MWGGIIHPIAVARTEETFLFGMYHRWMYVSCLRDKRSKVTEMSYGLSSVYAMLYIYTSLELLRRIYVRIFLYTYIPQCT